MLKIIGIILAVIILGRIVFGPVHNFINGLLQNNKAESEEQLIGLVSRHNPRVEEIQQILKDADFNPGAVDGMMGAKTRGAIREFQKASQLRPTGKIDSATWTALNKEKEALHHEQKIGVSEERAILDANVAVISGGLIPVKENATKKRVTKNILKEKELRFGECEWNFGTNNMVIEGHMINMISFTDIPFSESEIHCKKYSQFGISFDKIYLANYHASPVGYIQNPHIHGNYFHILPALDSLKAILKEKSISSWPFTNPGDPPEKKEGSMTIDQICVLLQHMLSFSEDYSKKEKFEYRKVGSDFMSGQENFFENPEALYFEREWRIILSFGTSPKYLPGIIEERGNYSFFKFDEKHIGPIVMPKEFIPKFKKESADIFSKYNKENIPTVLAYEDLKYI